MSFRAPRWNLAKFKRDIEILLSNAHMPGVKLNSAQKVSYGLLKL